MNKNSYDVNSNGKEGRLWFWLRLDYWSITDACLLIADIDPHSLVVTENNEFVMATSLKGVVYDDLSDDHGFAIESEIILSEYQDKYNNLHRWFNPNSLSNYPPTYWIDLAISKKIQIPWLDFAIEQGFYVSNVSTTEIVEVKKERPLNQRTENNYLRLIMKLAYLIKDFNPKKPYEAAKLIIEETDIDLSQQTIADYITKAYELESKLMIDPN